MFKLRQQVQGFVFEFNKVYSTVELMIKDINYMIQCFNEI